MSVPGRACGGIEGSKAGAPGTGPGRPGAVTGWENLGAKRAWLTCRASADAECGFEPRIGARTS